MKQTIEQFELNRTCEELSRLAYLEAGGNINPVTPESNAPSLLPTKSTETNESKQSWFRLNNESREQKTERLQNLLNEVVRRR